VGDFQVRIRLGDKEVEIRGTREEVLETFDNVDHLVERVREALDTAEKGEPEPPKEATHYPKIKYTDKCSEAVLALLETPWGNTPRSIRELREAMEANAIFFPKTTMSGVLVWLTKRGDLRRMKDPKRGYLYSLNTE